MILRRLALASLFLYPAGLPGASREIQELQRDVALLQQQLKDLQQSQNDKLIALTTLVQQALDAATKANTSLAVLENGIRNTLRDQENKVVAPVANASAKMDQLTSSIQTMQQSVEDLNGRMGKLEQRLVDLSNAVKTMQAPAPPPPGSTGTPPPGGASTGPPPFPAEVLYENARRDMSGGKADLALQEFTDYLKYYGDTELAPNAQFYVGEIHFSQGQYDQALKDYDMVLEKYSDNNKTPDALYKKGVTLVKMGRRTQGAQEFLELIKRFPNSDLAAKAREQRKAMGLSNPPTSTPRKSATKRKRAA